MTGEAAGGQAARARPWVGLWLASPSWLTNWLISATISPTSLVARSAGKPPAAG
jgi:hypothetical protein